MKRVIIFIKLVLIGIFSYFIFKKAHPFFFLEKEKRFKIAESYQGSYVSQAMFNILTYQYPNYSDAYFEQSVAFNKRGDYEKGFKLLNQAVELDPKLHLGYRGWLKLHKIKDYEGCIIDLHKLDSLTPNFVDAPWGDNIHHVLGLAYKGLKNYESALNEFDKNIETESDSSWVNPNTFLYKGIIFNELGEYDKAILNFNACLDNNDNFSVDAFFHKGISFKKLNMLDSAKVNFKKSMKLFNDGYKMKDVYNEVQDELYLTDIVEELKHFDE